MSSSELSSSSICWIRHAVFSEPDNVRLPGARQIREKARMFFHPPAARDVAKTVEDELRWLKCTVAVAEGRPHPVVAESYDVSPTRRGFRSTRQCPASGDTAIDVTQNPPIAPGTPN